MIRVIGGEFKGQKIPTVPDFLLIRPILARIKKSLFDILSSQISQSRFLDLFAGTGSVGLEALSRGANRVVFVEENHTTQKRLQDLIQKWRTMNPQFFEDKEVRVFCRDISQGFQWLGERFNIIFSGAPYVDRTGRALFFVESLLHNLLKSGIVEREGLFIAQHHIKENFEIPDPWFFWRQERYGDSVLTFFKQK